jgi:hypothetical protein
MVYERNTVNVTFNSLRLNRISWHRKLPKRQKKAISQDVQGEYRDGLASSKYDIEKNRLGR